MRKVLFLTAMVAFLLTSSSWAADISGKWTITWWGAGAEESFPLDIKSQGENLTITGTHPAFKEMTGTGTLKGDAVTMTLKSSSMEIALTGKVSGNKMSGTREINSAGGGGQGGGGQGGAPGGDASGAPGGDAAGSPQGGGQGGAPQGGDASGAPQGGDQGGGGSAEGNENWTAVKN